MSNRFIVNFVKTLFKVLNAHGNKLTHWGRVTHICVGNRTIIGSDNGLSPGRRQAIIWTNDGFLLIGTLGTNFSEILIVILTFSFKKMRLKVSSAERRPFYLGLNVLTMPPFPCVCSSLTIADSVSISGELLSISENGFHRQIIYITRARCKIMSWKMSHSSGCVIRVLGR